MNRLVIRRAVLWVLTLTTAGVIFWFSSQTAEQSSELSGALTRGLLSSLLAFLRLTEEQQALVHELIRSAAHVGLFAGLGLFASLLVRSYTYRHWFPVAFIACTVYAVLDECHQSWFAAGRAFEFADVAKDCTGILLGAGVAVLLCLFRKRLVKGT